MCKNLLKEFFKENPYKEISAQRLIYSAIIYDGIEEIVDKVLLEKRLISEERLENLYRERKVIQTAQDPDIIFQLLRKSTEIINRRVLLMKALEFEEDILPKAVNRLVTSGHDFFIENSIRLLIKSKKDYTPLLKEKFAEIRSPYARSLFCLVLGFRGEEEIIPWMMDRYFEFEGLYPDENYHQDPLLALHELYHRFYKNA